MLIVAPIPDQSSITQLQGEINDVMLDCRLPGWDGHGAEPVSAEAGRLAHTFVRDIPPGVSCPTISADPDGCITFEWQVSPRRLVLVSVHPDHRIDYAALFDGEKACGTEPFFERASEDFWALVRRVYQA